MSDISVPKVPKWPFLLGDFLLVALALVLAWQTHSQSLPNSTAMIVGIVGSVALGAWLLCRPFLREYEAAVQASERSDLAGTLTQIRHLEGVGQQVSSAAAQLNHASQALGQVETVARTLTDKIAEERTQFSQFLQNFNDQEKQTLRLEVEKLRRGEQEALQVIVHLLDHTFALHQAGSRSGQPALANQLAHFRAACLDAVRRLGLAAHELEPGTGFNPEIHQPHDGQAVAVGAPLAATFACGYTFQGAPLRRIVVVTQAAAEAASRANPTESSNGPEEAMPPSSAV